MTRSNTPVALIGRGSESRTLTERIDAARAGHGGALVLLGAPGVGKTSVLESAPIHAANVGFEVLRTTGVQSETHLPFAGLHQLLGHVLRDLDRLPPTYSNALKSAFGMIDEVVTSPHLVAMAVLQLLGESTEREPLLLLVDDAQWIDGPTASALAFVVRRLESDPILLIAALRDGFESPLLEAAIPELRIEALTDAAARTLLDAHAPQLDSGQRDRVLAIASGNPLALVELSAALRGHGEGDRLFHGSDVPLTARLERAFADRLTSLAHATRSFLRVASADERGLLAELVDATARLEGSAISLGVATEAKAARLVEVDDQTLRFRHPLMRSAIHQAMSLEERQAVHAALADTLAGDPDRRAWHRAAATLGTNAEVAAELEQMWARATKRGALGMAFEATERAMRFTKDPERRGKLLVRAAYYSWTMGRANDVIRFLGLIDERDLSAADRVYFMNLEQEFGKRTFANFPSLEEYIEVCDRMRAEHRNENALHLLLTLSERAWSSNADANTCAAIVSVLERVEESEDDPRVISVLALASPVAHGASVLARLSRLPSEITADMKSMPVRVGLAARAVGDFARAERLFDAQIAYDRSQGRPGSIVIALALQAWTKIQRGDWRNAASMASEAGRLGEEIGSMSWTAQANVAFATVAAYRGEVEQAERFVADGEQRFLIQGPTPDLAMVQWPRGIAALASGRHAEAFHHLMRIFTPSDIAYHRYIRNWALVDLIEAAVHSGHPADAAVVMRELEPIAATSCNAQLAAALRYARAVVSPDEDGAVFRADAELADWPFVRARLQLAHGIWLRRQRRPADSRGPLRAARDAFDLLGAAPWGEQARRELRASGETSRRRSHDLIDALSPQELQIAQLAASGLSNKEIGQQLFLSHRTVASHLYRIFPKLGITARTHLRPALEEGKGG